MVSTIPKIIYQGSKILLATIRKSILEEIQQSRDAAKLRYKEKQLESTSPNVKQISLDEAMRILNVEKLDAEEVEEKFKYMFEANIRSLYLQSKVFRAKQRIDAELNNVVLKNEFVNVPNK